MYALIGFCQKAQQIKYFSFIKKQTFKAESRAEEDCFQNIPRHGALLYKYFR